MHHLGITKAKKLKIKTSLPQNIEEFDGYYKINPVQFEMFAYLDLLFNSIKVESMNDKLLIKSNQNKTYSLLPVGNNLFRKEDRANPLTCFI